MKTKIFCLLIALLAACTQAQYTFGPQVQTTNTASITYDSGTGGFQYTNADNPTKDTAYLPLTGTAAAFITASNGWTTSLSINISPKSLAATSTQCPRVLIGMAVFSPNGPWIGILSGQFNNTGNAENSTFPNSAYGAAAVFLAQTNGNNDVTTPMGTSESVDGESLLMVSGGTSHLATTESIGAVSGVLTLSYNASSNIMMGYYNGTPLGSYSPASWRSNPPLTLTVFGQSGQGVAVPVGTDMASNFYVAPFATSAQPSSFQWAKRIASASGFPVDHGPLIGVTVDSQDNCYVTGWFDGTNNFGGVTLTNQSIGGSDIFVAKYNSSGALQWARRAGGNAGNMNSGRAVGVDTNGNVYVAGAVYGPATFDTINLPASSGEEFVLAKYNSTGAVQWVQSSTGGSDEVYASGLAVDNAGNSYVLVEVGNLSGQATSVTLGSTNVSIADANGEDPVEILVKYDSAGSVEWAQLLDSSEEVYANGAAVDPAGNVYVEGVFVSTLTIGTSNLVGSVGTKNLFVAKFNNSGVLTWVEQATGGNAGGGGVAVDAAGNVFVSSLFTNTINFGGITLTNGGALVAQYNQSGVIQWARRAGGPNGGGPNNLGGYVAVALDAQTNVYAAGILNDNAAVAAYSPAGAVQWASLASGPPASPFGSLAECAVDSAGDCYLAGWYQGTATFGTNVLQPQGTWNFFLAKVAPPTPPTLGITLTNGLPQLSVAGDIGSLFSLQSSPFLSATNTPWQTMTTLTLTNRPQLYLDTSTPTGTTRFYRAGPPAL